MKCGHLEWLSLSGTDPNNTFARVTAPICVLQICPFFAQGPFRLPPILLHRQMAQSHASLLLFNADGRRLQTFPSFPSCLCAPYQLVQAQLLSRLLAELLQLTTTAEN